MKHDRISRINERVREELSAALYRISPAEGADIGKISIVAVKVSPDLHNAAVDVSVLGDERDAARLMSWLRSHRADFQHYIAEKVALKYTPVLSFRQTKAIAQGARVLDILDELGLGGTAAVAPPPQEPPAS